MTGSSTSDTYDFTVAEIPKSRSEKIVVRSGSFHGKPRVDIRIYFLADDDVLRPTKKGVSVAAEQVPDLIHALQVAQSLPAEPDHKEALPTATV